MTPADLAAISKVTGQVIREFTAQAVREAVAPLLERNAALEMRILELETRPPQVGPVGPAGPKGDPGERGDVMRAFELNERGLRASIIELVDGAVNDAIEALPRPKDGRDGIDGKDGAPGRDGRDGLHGKDGAPGERGLPGEKGLDGVAGRDGRDGAPGPAGAPGEKGMDGLAGRDGRDGAPGEKGIDGRDGVDGINGKDGIDGLGFDDFDLTLDDSRGWILRLTHGDRAKEFPVPMPFFAGNWEAGTTYPKAAGVRWDGHYWWALKQTHEQPGEGSTAWAIVVSRGKQGREGKQGKDGRPGRDLTQMDPSTGQKW